MKKKIEKPLDWRPDWLYDDGIKSWVKPWSCNVCKKCYRIMKPDLLKYDIVKCICNGPFEGYIEVK